jgi:methionine-rich copper-binding protein CopC
MKTQRSFVGATVFLVILLSGQSPASAHAELKQAAPAAGGSVSAAPTEVTLNFNERLEPTFSTIMVRDAVGKRVDKADARLDQRDRATMRVSLQPLTNGIYIVEWRALTADTHRTEGAFIFRIGE